VAFGTSGINVGSGQYTISLPFTLVGYETFSGTARQGGSGNPYFWAAEGVSGDNAIIMKVLPGTAGNTLNNLSNSSPVTWTASSRFTCTGSYHWI
jgi:hypothetical protein